MSAVLLFLWLTAAPIEFRRDPARVQLRDAAEHEPWHRWLARGITPGRSYRNPVHRTHGIDHFGRPLHAQRVRSAGEARPYDESATACGDEHLGGQMIGCARSASANRQGEDFEDGHGVG